MAKEEIYIIGRTSSNGGGVKPEDIEPIVKEYLSKHQWFGSEEEFRSIPESELDYDTIYFINSQSYNELTDKPIVNGNVSELKNDVGYTTTAIVNGKIQHAENRLENKIDTKINSSDWFGTQDEFDAIEDKNKDTSYYIEQE